MFRLAKCDEFMDLKKKHARLVRQAGENARWGLKMNGHLFVYDRIAEQRPRTVLEAGAGLNLIIARALGREIEYWMIDDGSLYPDPAQFRANLASLKNIRHVDGFLGDFSKELPDRYFDMVFSVPVLEHTQRPPSPRVEMVCRDMFRVLKPGGCAIHTIDVVPTDDIGLRYLDAMRKTGFLFRERPSELDWDVSKKNNQILLERLDTVYLKYYEKAHQLHQPVVFYHFGSILVMAFKPPPSEGEGR